MKPVAAVTGIAGAVAIAGGHATWILPALVLWSTSSLIWAYVGFRQREWSLAVLSVAYVLIDLVGMWRWGMVAHE